MSETGAVVAEESQPEKGLPEPPEGVRDPWKGLRGIMAATLALEFITFLLALPVVWKFGGGVSSAGFVIVIVLSVLMLVAAFVQRRPWGLPVALTLQLAMIACWPLVPALGALGILFALVWTYFLWLRHDLARRLAGNEPH